MRSVYREEGNVENRGVVSSPAQGNSTGFALQYRCQDGRECVTVTGRTNVEVLVGPIMNEDGLRKMHRLLPASVRGPELLSLLSRLLQVEVLDIGTKICKPPGDVRIVADDDERNPGKRNAGSMEISGLQVGLVPDSRNRMA